MIVLCFGILSFVFVSIVVDTTQQQQKRRPPGALVIDAHLPLAKCLATNLMLSLKSKHEVEYEYEHADHHEMVCLIVMSARSLLLII
jgi:hypothetical protein